ncbi:hypothetical protein D3C80_2179720 [compost metagenome]
MRQRIQVGTFQFFTTPVAKQYALRYRCQECARLTCCNQFFPCQQTYKSVMRQIRRLARIA